MTSKCVLNSGSRILAQLFVGKTDYGEASRFQSCVLDGITSLILRQIMMPTIAYAAAFASKIRPSVRGPFMASHLPHYIAKSVVLAP